LSRVQEERKTVVQSEEELAKALKGRDQTIAKLTAEYDTLKRDSAEFLKLKSLYQSTQARLETAEASVKSLSSELDALRASQRNRWFALGALVLLCGLMIGVVMGRRERKRRTYF
jgi:SH3 domain protein